MAALIPDASDEAIADWLEGRLRSALAAGAGPVAVAVPGGSTPFPILAQLAGRALAWERLHFWPTDDRCVPDDHPASNGARLQALLLPLGAVVVPLSDVQQAPHFALSWLGMGADGHVASLFPNTNPRLGDPLLVRRLTPDPLPPEAPFDRITLTLPALLASDELLLVIRGEEKRAVLAAALAGESDLPIARLLGAARQPVTCFT